MVEKSMAMVVTRPPGVIFRTFEVFPWIGNRSRLPTAFGNLIWPLRVSANSVNQLMLDRSPALRFTARRVATGVRR